MKDLKLFLDLIRIEKPIGIMLLFWPCLWGLTLGNDFSNNDFKYLTFIAYFFLGSILMRSAGCIINDIADKEFDKKVSRTKNRPIASGKISVKSPIGKGLLGKKKGDLAVMNVPAGEVKFKILEISYD